LTVCSVVSLSLEIEPCPCGLSVSIHRTAGATHPSGPVPGPWLQLSDEEKDMFDLHVACRTCDLLLLLLLCTLDF